MDERPTEESGHRLLRDAMRPFVARDSTIAYAAVLLDFGVYLTATVLAITVDATWLKAVLAFTAGIMISTLFVLGHDATHGSLVASSRQNRVLGRLLFLPSLHNYTLWRIQHNRLHHQSPNVKGINSWSPFSPDEFRALPRWRRGLERVYRGGGFGLYYLVERWSRHKFVPLANVDPAWRRAAWMDVVPIVAWLTLLVAGIVKLGANAGHSWLASLWWGFVLPFLVWNWSMGLTVFLQHTHFCVPWFRDAAQAARHGGQEEVTVHVRYPRWYGRLSHDIMEHPAHHINPLIPFYRLNAAQTRLLDVLGDAAIVERVGPRYIRALMRRCKLYDYDRQEWTDFTGTTTATTNAAFTDPMTHTGTA
ncbi:MAG TPA: fatty acid desaturase [Casimicrobiaceae bacterium]|nr:fatty acid desaturase [Casimicrobiaceae bacterium]